MRWGCILYSADGTSTSAKLTIQTFPVEKASIRRPTWHMKHAKPPYHGSVNRFHWKHISLPLHSKQSLQLLCLVQASLTIPVRIPCIRMMKNWRHCSALPKRFGQTSSRDSPGKRRLLRKLCSFLRSLDRSTDLRRSV